MDQAEESLRAIPGVRDVSGLRLRWIGHLMHAEASVVADADLTLLAAHEIAADAEHQLTHRVPRLTAAMVHADPASHPGDDHHTELSHHRRDWLAFADPVIVPTPPPPPYPGPMARPRPHVCNAARRRAQNLGVLLIMVLVAFAGAMLFSAGSDHHRFDTATAGPVVPAAAGEQLSLDGPGGHDHHRGNEWTPTASSRFRIIAPAVTTVQPRHELTSPSPIGDTPAAGTALSSVGELTQPGVLRV